MDNQGDIGSGSVQPAIIPRPEHIVSRASISSSALKVLYRLKEAGFQSFLAEQRRILRDNVYGSIEDEAWRRDFTVNGLYFYDLKDFPVVDYVGGLDDLNLSAVRPEPATEKKLINSR